MSTIITIIQKKNKPIYYLVVEPVLLLNIEKEQSDISNLH